MTTDRARLAAVMALCVTGVWPVLAHADKPLSAIDWLSDTVSPASAPRALRPDLAPQPGTGSPVDTITTLPLDAPNPDAAGVLSARMTGLPINLWTGSVMDDAIAAIARSRSDPLPVLRDFEQMMLLAELPPPHDSDGKGRFLIARVDRLLDLAALEAAGALLDMAGKPTPDLFRRSFDIALLLGTEDTACSKLRESPGIAPTLTARIFCLARGGDWQAAALTFNTGQALGQLSPDEEAVLERFLDPDLFEDEAPLLPSEKLTPLTLRLYEAIGEALPGNTLPLAFAHSELSAATGWKARLEAGERLARAGAITPGQLMALYTERMPAASGGIWTRVDAVQRFDTAIAAGDPVGVANALRRAYDAMQSVELEVPFAEYYSDHLIRLPLPPDAATLALGIVLLSPRFEDAAQAFEQVAEEGTFLRGLAQGRTAAVPLSDRMARAIAPVFAQTTTPVALSMQLESLLDKGALGEAILFAIARISEGATSDPRSVTEGLALLRRVGLETLARRAALQLMILERRG